MSDRIAIEGLRIAAYVGVYPHEGRVKQPLLVDVILETDVAPAAQTDDVDLTVNYGRVAELVREVVTARHYNLIETVAEGIGASVLAAFGKRIAAVKVRVAKPQAIPEAQTVAIEIERRP